jgi:hypothetical protein
VIKLTQSAWDEINEHQSKFDIKFRKDLLDGIDAVMKTVIEDKEVDSIDIAKDFKMDELKVKDKKLQKVSEKVKK